LYKPEIKKPPVNQNSMVYRKPVNKKIKILKKKNYSCKEDFW
jgi:hypothetical protein